MRVVTFDRTASVLPPPSVARIDPWTFFYLLGGNKGYQLEDIVDVTSPSSELFPHALDWHNDGAVIDVLVDELVTSPNEELRYHVAEILQSVLELGTAQNSPPSSACA